MKLYRALVICDDACEVALQHARGAKQGGESLATDIFAKIGDIKGESQDAKHKDEVEVLSWSWGVSQTGGTGGGRGSGKASFSDFHFTHHIDKASLPLMAACATGKHVKDATITNRKAGKSRRSF